MNRTKRKNDHDTFNGIKNGAETAGGKTCVVQNRIQMMSGVNKKNPRQIRQILNSTAIGSEKIAKENQYLLLDDTKL